MRVLEVSQARQFLATCAAEGSGVANMLAMALWMGWRVESELGGLCAGRTWTRSALTMRLSQVWLCKPTQLVPAGNSKHKPRSGVQAGRNWFKRAHNLTAYVGPDGPQLGQIDPRSVAIGPLLSSKRG